MAKLQSSNARNKERNIAPRYISGFSFSNSKLVDAQIDDNPELHFHATIIATRSQDHSKTSLFPDQLLLRFCN
jgi:hypothetical protein